MLLFVDNGSVTTTAQWKLWREDNTLFGEGLVPSNSRSDCSSEQRCLWVSLVRTVNGRSSGGGPLDIPEKTRSTHRQDPDRRWSEKDAHFGFVYQSTSIIVLETNYTIITVGLKVLIVAPPFFCDISGLNPPLPNISVFVLECSDERWCFPRQVTKQEFLVGTRVGDQNLKMY